ncbi:cilia- and flagella-associated protein 45-like isoform X1 [Vespa crabro]|uniref:cilia- and flagella-associated protein 45-like isoform X1 n=2 Tax=Vespa crabro TaxID=7445 RepID=UPI001F003209|nr:cilia- and flagella-associated protein 45-like isoform X1 [Vespa crabro]
MSKTLNILNATDIPLRKQASSCGKLKYRDNEKCTSGVISANLKSNILGEWGTEKTRIENGKQKHLTVSIGSKKPIIITRKEYEEFKKRGHYVTKEEKQATIAMTEEERYRLTKDSMIRKEAIRRMDLTKIREKDKMLNEVEEEAKKRTMHLLERAYNLKLEQEEEIQKYNRFILETKCRAIRDMQIAEKKLIKQELAEEEKRLNDMMENERRWAIEEDLKKEEEEISRKQIFSKILKDQITENEEQRILEFERKQEESQLINMNNITWQLAEIEKLRHKEAESAKIRRDLAEVNEQLKHFKVMEQEENRIIDLRIKQYKKYKEERETQLDEKQRLENLYKEQEKERLAVQAKHTQDLQAQIDAINADRIQEEVEREWRRKEKEEAMKKIGTIQDLRKGREEQINNKRLIQAIEINREKREFERILRVQKEAFCRDKKNREKKQQEALVHRSEILRQVNEKERERIQARQKMFEEGLAIRTQVAMRKKKLQEAMNQKCKEMRESKVPEIYINEVKRLIENID